MNESNLIWMLWNPVSWPKSGVHPHCLLQVWTRRSPIKAKNRHWFMNDSWCGWESQWLRAAQWVGCWNCDRSANEWCRSKGKEKTADGGEEPVLFGRGMKSCKEWRKRRRVGAGVTAESPREPGRTAGRGRGRVKNQAIGPRNRWSSKERRVHLLTFIFERLSRTHRWVCIFLRKALSESCLTSTIHPNIQN